MRLPVWSVELLAAVASAAAAIAAALFAWRSARLASQALDIAKRDHQERHSGLSAYLIDGVAWDDDRGRLVAFACSVSNTASAPLSIVSMELHLHVVASDGTATKLILAPQVAGAPAIWDLKALVHPLNLDPRATSSGWLGYSIPDRVAESMSIDKYEIVFQCSTGERVTLEKHILQRIENATPTN